MEPLSKYLSFLNDSEGGGWFVVTLADVGQIFVGWTKDGKPQVSWVEPPGDTIYDRVNSNGTIGKVVTDDI